MTHDELIPRLRTLVAASPTITDQDELDCLSEGSVILGWTATDDDPMVWDPCVMRHDGVDWQMMNGDTVEPGLPVLVLCELLG